MKFLVILAALCLFASCEKKPQVPAPADEAIPNLPSAAFSKPLSIDDSGFIELVFSAERVELHHQNQEISISDSGEETLQKQITKIREQNAKKQINSPLLVSAAGSTKFEKVRDQLPTAATTGMHKILFLVRNEKSSDTEIVSTELPTSSDSHLKIEPFFLHIDSAGKIYSGTGAGRQLLAKGDSGSDLSNIDSQFELYSAAARSAGVPEPICQIYIDPQASYQRAIDLANSCRKCAEELVR